MAEKIPDAELDILAALCRRGEAAASEIRRDIEPFRPMEHGSVVSLLGRLEEKGYVTKRKGDVGKAFVFSPTTRGRRMIRPVVRDLLERLFAGSRIDFMASLYQGAAATPDEIRRLESLVEELRSRRKRTK